jgi:hypothetical protein
MADNTDNQSLENFSIQNTMEMGMGSQELLDSLYSDETAGNPDDVTEIVKEVEDPEKKPEGRPKGKDIVQTEEGEELSGEQLISSFLGSGDEEEEEEEVEKIVPKKKNIQQASAGEEEEEEGEEGEEETSNQFSALANDLKTLGVFTQEEGEEEEPISTPEQFRDRFLAEKKKGAIEMVDNFIGQFGEDYQQAFDAIFVKGVDPKEYFGTYNAITNFTELDLSDEANQERVMRQALIDQGFDSEDVASEIERLKNYGDLESVAAKHHKVLIKKENSKLQQMQADAEKELQTKNAIKNQYISNVQTILQEKLKEKTFDGIPINPKLASELQDFLLVDKYKTKSGETLTDFDKAILEMKRPENHASKVKIALLLKIMEKDPNLSTIQRTGITKKSNALFSETAKQVTKARTPMNTNPKPKSWFEQ